LRFGAGLKGKVTQALAAGLPVVTTPIGSEGLDASDGEQLLIGESPVDIAERVLRVMHDSELWERLSRSGQQLAAERCSVDLMERRLLALLQDGAQARVRKRAATAHAR
jgi:glycosyltransferase involved in cell wall biosynthesis